MCERRRIGKYSEEEPGGGVPWGYDDQMGINLYPDPSLEIEEGEGRCEKESLEDPEKEGEDELNERDN